MTRRINPFRVLAQMRRSRRAYPPLYTGMSFAERYREAESELGKLR